MFSGQGSQFVGMGKEFEETVPELYKTYSDIYKVCQKGPEDKLNDTYYSQLCVLLVNHAAYLTHMQKNDGEIYAVAGFSLGEYNALAAAYMLPFSQVVELVMERARLMQSAASATKGAMIAVSGAAIARVKEIANSVEGYIDISNYNSPDQIVLAGEIEAVEKAEQLLESEGYRHTRLRTSGGFHSQLMHTAEKKFRKVLEGYTFNKPSCKIMSNLTGTYYGDDMDEVKESLALHISHPVKWQQEIEQLLLDGATDFIECGTGSTLTKLVNRIKRKLK